MFPETTRLLRHTVAAIAYRLSRSLRDAPSGFENVRLTDDGWSARDLLLHITNVMAFALAAVTNTDRVHHDVLDWQGTVDRFYALLGELDAELVRCSTLESEMVQKLIQGPFADAFSHIGQLNAMRRKAGSPVAPVSYIKAEIKAGCIALNDQPE